LSARSRDIRFVSNNCPGGLVVLKDGEFAPSGIETVLTGQVVMTLFEDAENTLWAGTYGRGLIRVRGGQTTSCGREQGLGSDFICQIQDDGLGFL
jgi:ligand-binding sensor domain-containing protein